MQAQVESEISLQLTKWQPPEIGGHVWRNILTTFLRPALATMKLKIKDCDTGLSVLYIFMTEDINIASII